MFEESDQPLRDDLKTLIVSVPQHSTFKKSHEQEKHFNQLLSVLLFFNKFSKCGIPLVFNSNY